MERIQPWHACKANRQSEVFMKSILAVLCLFSVNALAYNEIPAKAVPTQIECAASGQYVKHVYAGMPISSNFHQFVIMANEDLVNCGRMASVARANGDFIKLDIHGNMLPDLKVGERADILTVKEAEKLECRKTLNGTDFV